MARKKRQQASSAKKTDRRFVGVAVALAIVTFVVYVRVFGHEFTSYDDDVYVTKNRSVQAGLTIDSIAWALTTGHGSNWHPLTWLSLMLDCQIYGLRSAGHHLTNLILHIANALLLLHLLRRMTGNVWASAMVAALFALHPLHVESVAWVAERKDVLSTLFWLLTMLLYLRYVEEPGVRRLIPVLIVFALGLMSKPMLVTLPFVLLLCDFWPLGRVAPASIEPAGNPRLLQRHRRKTLHRTVPKLVIEKVPFFVITVTSCVITFLVQQHGGEVVTLEEYSFEARLGNAIVVYVTYLVKTVWPVGLAFFYPHPLGGVPAWKILGAVALLLGTFVLVIRYWRSHPYLIVGWLWYMGTLVPVIGLVQVGEQSMADRYTYVPLIGIFVAAVWCLSGVMPTAGAYGRRLTAVIAGIILTACCLCTWRQVIYWRNDTAMCEHALEVTTGNYKAHNNLGLVMENLDRFDDAIRHYTTAVNINPNHERYYNLGNAYRKKEVFDEAIKYYEKAIDIHPGYARAYNNLGSMYYQQGQRARVNADYEAAEDKMKLARTGYERAVELKPESAEFRTNLGAACEIQGDIEVAVRHYDEALRLDTESPAARTNLDRAKGKLDAENRDSGFGTRPVE